MNDLYQVYYKVIWKPEEPDDEINALLDGPCWTEDNPMRGDPLDTAQVNGGFVTAENHQALISALNTRSYHPATEPSP